MGIPSYFNFVLKNHKHIIINTKHISCDYFFIDANSLIYDSYYEIKNKTEEQQCIHDYETLYNLIYETVWLKILSFVKDLRVKKEIYICFDGIPPIAKMYQQKQRRYKSFIEKNIIQHHTQNIKFHSNANNIVTNFDTNHITPGTMFMNDLDVYIQEKVDKFNQISDMISMHFSPTSEIGEGEHKICNYIRYLETSRGIKFKEENCVIYGLDADLIMLGLLLLDVHKQVFLYKETRHFSYIEHIKEENKYYFSMMKLGIEITRLMQQSDYVQGIMDYCFIGLLCGNDFMPHTPSINIRNSGINLLINSYKYVKHKHGTTKYKLIDTDTKNIKWSNFYKLLEYMSRNEYDKINENLIWKLKLKMKIKVKDFTDKLNFLPLYDNSLETELSNDFNKDKYNEIVLHSNEDKIQEICRNYFEVLEWNWKYYNGDMKMRNVVYKYCHGPLLVDMVKYIPIFEDSYSFLDKKNDIDHNNIHKLTLLYYVMPPSQYEKYNSNKINDAQLVRSKFLQNIDPMEFCKITYFMCKYFWESKLYFEDCEFMVLNNFIQSNFN